MTERLPNLDETGYDAIIKPWLKLEHNADGTHKVDGTSIEVASSVMRLKDGGVTEAKIAPNSITSASLADTIANFQGAWSSATTYAIGDTVSYQGGDYICIAAHSNQAPPNVTYWAVFSYPVGDYKFLLERYMDQYNATNITTTGLRPLYTVTGQLGPLVSSGNPAIPEHIFYLDPADYPVPEAGQAGARTLKLRLAFWFQPNGTSVGTTITAGLYTPTGWANGAANANPTISGGTLVTSSGCAVTPGANTTLVRNTTEIAFPAAGQYFIGVVPGAALAASSGGFMSARLGYRWA